MLRPLSCFCDGLAVNVCSFEGKGLSWGVLLFESKSKLAFIVFLGGHSRSVVCFGDRKTVNIRKPPLGHFRSCLLLPKDLRGLHIISFG